MEILAPPGMEELTNQIQGMFQNLSGGRRRTRKLRVREALRRERQAATDPDIPALVDALRQAQALIARLKQERAPIGAAVRRVEARHDQLAEELLEDDRLRGPEPDAAGGARHGAHLPAGDAVRDGEREAGLAAVVGEEDRVPDPGLGEIGRAHV